MLIPRMSELCVAANSAASINHPVRNWCVAVDPAVAQKWPIAADLLQGAKINFSGQNLFFIVRAFGDHTTEGIAEERTAPEFEPSSGSGVAANVAGFVPYAIDYSNIYTVCDGVGD